MASSTPPSPPKPLNRPLKNILVLSATGNIGRPIIAALAAHPTANYTITATTRDASKFSPSTFPPGVKLITSDLSTASLIPLFKQTDAIVSCVSVPLLSFQKDLIDLAISCGVARFMPSEFGINTSHPLAPSLMPLLQPKIDTQTYLAQKAAKGLITYTTIYNGAFFDWFFRFPDGMGWDMEGARGTFYDGGSPEYEVTTVERIGEVVAAALSPEHWEETRNQRVFINSFTLTQKQLLPELEKAVGRSFVIREDTTKGLKDRTMQRCGDLGMSADDTVERQIAPELLTACLAGAGGLNLYSKDPEVGGLWNRRLGLKQESLQKAVEDVVNEGKKTGLPEGMKAY